MTTQYTILQTIKTICESVAGVAFVDFYPDAKYRVGQRFPAVIIQDGDEGEKNLIPGGCIHYNYAVPIMIIHELRSTPRIEDILQLQKDIETAIYATLSLQSEPANILNISISKGGINEPLPFDLDGYDGEISQRTINLNLYVKEAR
jgi:hypothetical protein